MTLLRFIAATLLLFFCEAHRAEAAYEFCNETSYVLDSAVGVQNKNDALESRGWFRLYPGFCAEVLAEPLKRRDYYIYARSLDIYNGEVKIFGGDQALCVASEHGKPFHIRDTVLCREYGYEKTGFLPVAVRRQKKSSVFSERHLFPSRRHAIVAGVQRLLRQNGFDIGEIDGYAGRTTLRAVKEFQKLAGMRPTGVITKRLFDRLISRARSRDEGPGLRFCNETSYVLWSAFGHRTTAPKPEFESQGWVKLLPRQCRQVLRGRLERSIYYAYAEAVDEKGARMEKGGRSLVWAGDFPMCVKRTLFRIAGREDCLKRQYQEVSFRRIETGGASEWTEPFREAGEAE